MESTPLLILSAMFLTLLVLSGVAFVLRRQKKQRPYSTVIDPNVTVTRVWATWMEADLDDSMHKLRAEARRILAPHQRKAIYDDLLDFEEKMLEGQYPLTRLRKEIMASVDRRMINVEILKLPEDEKKQLRDSQADVIQSDSHAREYILANELRMAILREFAAQRYGDRADNDWLHVYEKAAQFKRRLTKARILQGLAAQEESEQDSRQQAIDVVDKQLQMRLLQVPPGTSFKRDEDS